MGEEVNAIDIEQLDVSGQNAPITELTDIDAVSWSSEKGASRNRVDVGSGTYLDALLVNKGADILVVSFHGSLNRSQTELPRFERLSSLLKYDVNSLFFGDPSLFINDSVSLTWYTGRPGQDLVSKIADWVMSAMTAVGAKKVVLSGSSGGGFAALQVSAQIPSSLAVVFNPQTRIGRYFNGLGDPTQRTSQRSYVDAVYPELVESWGGD